MAKNLIEKITEKQINPNVPEFRVGDTVCVDCKIIEEKGGKEKERIQKFEGIVISRKGTGATETFTVRKISSLLPPIYKRKDNKPEKGLLSSFFNLILTFSSS